MSSKTSSTGEFCSTSYIIQDLHTHIEGYSMNFNIGIYYTFLVHLIEWIVYIYTL